MLVGENQALYVLMPQKIEETHPDASCFQGVSIWKVLKTSRVLYKSRLTHNNRDLIIYQFIIWSDKPSNGKSAGHSEPSGCCPAGRPHPRSSHKLPENSHPHRLNLVISCYHIPTYWFTTNNPERIQFASLHRTQLGRCFKLWPFRSNKTH